MSVLFDSNILVYYLNASLPIPAKHFVDQSLEQDAWISVITRIEILGWKDQTPEMLQRDRRFISQFKEQPLVEAIVERCIALRQRHRLKIPDVIIAATALHLNLPLATRNLDDFRNIDGVQLINPFDAKDSPA